MEFIIISGEPLHGAVARFAKNRNQQPQAALRVLLNKTRGESLSFILPTHLDAIARNLPSALGVTAGWLLHNNSFFPAVAPFLEEEERGALRTLLFEGKKPTGYPICGGRHATAIAQTIRYCPKCAAEDRELKASSRLNACGARWRREHNLYGVDACWLHGCMLVSTGARFDAVRELHEADSVIPEWLPPDSKAEDTDVLIARDLNCLFTEGCPLPGRRRIAAALREEAGELGFERSSRQVDLQAIEGKVRETFPSAWLERRGVKFTAVSTAWGRNAMSSNAQVFPAITTAIVARALGLPLPRLLEAASVLAPIPRVKAGKRRASHWIRPASREEVESRRERFLAIRRSNPGFSRSEIYRAANHLMSLLTHNDAEWLQANLPPKKEMNHVSAFDWSEMDLRSAEIVRRRAMEIRVSSGKPRRITGQLLRFAAGQRGRTGVNWEARLPLLHEALRAETESDFQYAQRRLNWIESEIASGKLPPLHGSAYLQRSGMEVLVKIPEIRDLVVQTIAMRGTSPIRRGRGCAILRLAS